MHLISSSKTWTLDMHFISSSKTSTNNLKNLSSFLSLKWAAFDDELKRKWKSMSLMRFFYLLNFYQHGHVLYILIKDINLYLEDLIFFLLSKWAAFDDELKKGYQKSIILIKDINLYLQELKLFLLLKWAGFDDEKKGIRRACPWWEFFYVLNFY